MRPHNPKQAFHCDPKTRIMRQKNAYGSSQKRIDDLFDYHLPDPKTAGRIPLAMRFARLQAENGLPVFFSSRSPFTVAANISGLENFCRWMVRKPELCRELMHLALDHLRKSGSHAASDRIPPADIRPVSRHPQPGKKGPRRIHPGSGVRHPGHGPARECLCHDQGGTRYRLVPVAVSFQEAEWFSQHSRYP